MSTTFLFPATSCSLSLYPFLHCPIGLTSQVRSLFADTPGHRNRKPVLESQPGWNPPIGTLRMTTLGHFYIIDFVDGDWPVPLLPSPHVSVQSVAMNTAQRLEMARIRPCVLPSRFRCTVHIICRNPRCSLGFLLEMLLRSSPLSAVLLPTSVPGGRGLRVSSSAFAVAVLASCPARDVVRSVRHEGYQRAPLERSQAATPVEGVTHRHSDEHRCE